MWEVRFDQTGTSTGGGPWCPLCVAMDLLSADDNAELFSSAYSQEFLTTAVILEYSLYRIISAGDWEILPFINNEALLGITALLLLIIPSIFSNAALFLLSGAQLLMLA